MLLEMLAVTCRAWPIAARWFAMGAMVGAGTTFELRMLATNVITAFVGRVQEPPGGIGGIGDRLSEGEAEVIQGDQ